MEAMAESSLSELLQSLEQASAMAKQLPSTTNPSHLIQIYNSLQQAHLNLSTFLSRTQFPQSLPLPLPSMNENSLSSATSAAFNDDGNEPMQLGDDEPEQNSKGTIEVVEEKMRDCFINNNHSNNNKRIKRQLSPSAEERRFHDDGLFGSMLKDFDPQVSRLKALDLISQFHA